MSKTIAYAGVLAAALLLSSAGAAAAETDGGYLGPAGELLPGSVTGSLPGYTSGPLGSPATLACNIGTVVGTAAQLMGAGLPIPVGIICAVVNPVAESADFLLDGDIDGSVGAVVGGVPLVGDSLEGQIDTASATDSVEGVLGERLGSLAEESLSPEPPSPQN